MSFFFLNFLRRVIAPGLFWEPCVRSLSCRVDSFLVLNSFTLLRYFEIFIILTILVNCVFLALTNPPEEPE